MRRRLVSMHAGIDHVLRAVLLPQEMQRAIAKQAEAKLAAGRIKGRSVKVRLL